MKYFILLNITYYLNLLIINNSELSLKNIFIFNYKNFNKVSNNKKLLTILVKSI
jgi:hypothetical protein